MRITQRMLVDNVQANIGMNAESLAGLQDQLSSGKRIRRPSDDPQGISRAMTLKTSSERNAQYLRNITSARGWLEATDTELSHMTDVLTRARDIGLRAASDSIGADGRLALGEQIDGLLEEMVQSTNSSHDGKFLFSGRQVTTMPFEADRTDGRIAVVNYRGDSGELGRDIGGEVAMGVNIPGDAAVSGQRVIQRAVDTLIAMRRQLSGEATGSPTGATNAQIEQLSTSVDGIATLRGMVGSKMNRIDATESNLDESQTNLATMLSRTQDADMAEVMTNLMMRENVYRSALAAGARVIQPSLLDFLR